MKTNFSDFELFSGISDEEGEKLLSCLESARRIFQKGETIFSVGETTERLGLVLSGRVITEHNDYYGGRTIVGSAAHGAVFALSYACVPGAKLPVNVVAAEESEVLFLNVRKALVTCPETCPFHSKLVENLLTACAEKNLELSRKILHTSPKTIRGKLLSLFSEYASKETGSFVVPFNRQQLADFLGVDRSALCAELSKMKRDGILDYRKNNFTLKRNAEDEENAD